MHLHHGGMSGDAVIIVTADVTASSPTIQRAGTAAVRYAGAVHLLSDCDRQSPEATALIRSAPVGVYGAGSTWSTRSCSRRSPWYSLTSSR